MLCVQTASLTRFCGGEGLAPALRSLVQLGGLTDLFRPDGSAEVEESAVLAEGTAMDLNASGLRRAFYKARLQRPDVKTAPAKSLKSLATLTRLQAESFRQRKMYQVG